MKKIFLFLVLSFSIVLSGCVYNIEEYSLKVIVPNGGPAFGVAKIMDDGYDVEVVNGTDLLVSAFTEPKQSYDVIIAPTNLGAKMYNNDIDYKMVSSYVWGNLYLVSKQDLSVEDLSGKTIAAFGQNATPDIIMQAVFNELEIINDVTIQYYSSVADVNGLLLSGQADVALLAEPVLSVAKTRATLYTIIDFQEEWETMTGDSSYPQASVFVKANVLENHKKDINDFLTALEASVDITGTDPNAVGDIIEEFDSGETKVFGFSKAIVVDSITRSNLDYQAMTNTDTKDAVVTYLQYIKDFNVQLIGGKMPDDDFYYQGE